jgi:glucose-1-phosphate thymidylyltransferase
MIGIVLAGGMGTRLYPITRAFSKQLLPIYDKPMVYYPIATLMAAGIRSIIIVSTPNDLKLFERLLGDGSEYGVKFSYKVQPQPRGIAEVFSLCSSEINGLKVCLVLGDNFFHGTGLGRELSKFTNINGAHIFGYSVANPSGYGVLELDQNKKIISLEEKPKIPKSRLAIPGLYFYDENIVDISRKVPESDRGELEITDVNRAYLAEGNLTASILPRGTAWFDMGSHDSILDAANYVRILENRQGIKLACLEELGWIQGWISDQELKNLAKDPKNAVIREYLNSLLGKI